MHNAVMCTLSLYDVIGITWHLHTKLKSFSNIVQPLHKEALRGCLFLYIIAMKKVIMSEAFLIDVSIFYANSSLSSQVLCRKHYISMSLGECKAKLWISVKKVVKNNIWCPGIIMQYFQNIFSLLGSLNARVWFKHKKLVVNYAVS